MAQEVSLREKFYGCICGSQIGSAMGAPPEGMSYDEIEEKFGTVDRLLPYSCYGTGWVREPGTTEDGIERQKLMITAVVEKQDRVNAEDVKKIWIRDIKPEGPGMLSEVFDGKLHQMAKSGIPARDLGTYCDYANIVSFPRSCHAIGMINAGDEMGAVNDIFEVGQLYHVSNSNGLRWASVTAVGIAAAMKPNATVDSVIESILKYSDHGLEGKARDHWMHDSPSAEIERELKRTENCKDFRELRAAFDDTYQGFGIPYPMSYANEVVTKAICIFRMVKGNTMNAMIAGVNMGRDTDCVTAVAAGISGALSGASFIPESFIKQTDYATSVNEYTNSKWTLRETADGLYDAYKARLKRMKAYCEEMDI